MDYKDVRPTYVHLTKGKGFIDLFKRNGMKTFLLDEYKTSSVCPDCDGDVEKGFKTRPSSRPWRRKDGHIEKVHGLLGCCNQNCKQDYEMKFWNRDVLSVRNYLRIIDAILNGEERPSSLARFKKIR